MPILNQRKEKHKYVARPGIEPRTSDLRVRCPTDCATWPGLIDRSTTVCLPVWKIIHLLKLVDYFFVQADKPWYNYYILLHLFSLMLGAPVAEGEIFSTVKRVPLHTAFHYHPPIVLIWLKYCWKGRKITTRPVACEDQRTNGPGAHLSQSILSIQGSAVLK